MARARGCVPRGSPAVHGTFPIPGEGTPWQFSAVRYSMINVMLLPGWPGRCDPH